MSIRLFMGPMFSGKTTKLLVRYGEGPRCVAVKPSVDGRYGAGIIKSHDGYFIAAKEITDLSAWAMASVPIDTEVVLVDEGQFVKNLAAGCVALAKMGLEVCVAALNGTSENSAWSEISALIPWCTEIVHLSASKCGVCGRSDAGAPFTKYVGAAHKDGDVAIGGQDLYSPSCAKCVFKTQTLK